MTLGTPKHADSISKLVQYVGRYYVSYINHEYGRTGSLWEGRHKGALIDSDEYLRVVPADVRDPLTTG